ncbi:hypothetical protein [Brevibacillus sp. H7]|uniref:hypothetical protein n=1 Tax=Brevibacillus sp. H7 TaxID=3349138 RepID=UPI003812C0C0
MTPNLLVDELIKFIEPVVANFDLESNVKGIRKSPQVIGGYLEEKKPQQRQETPDFPYVIVRYLEDDDTDESNIASVRIIAGTYSEDEQNGWRDCMNVVTRIKQALLEQPIIGERFRVQKPMKTQLPEEQPFPEWMALLTVQVVIPQTEEEGGYLKDVFG